MGLPVGLCSWLPVGLCYWSSRLPVGLCRCGLSISRPIVCVTGIVTKAYLPWVVWVVHPLSSEQKTVPPDMSSLIAMVADWDSVLGSRSSSSMVISAFRSLVALSSAVLAISDYLPLCG